MNSTKVWQKKKDLPCHVFDSKIVDSMKFGYEFRTNFARFIFRIRSLLRWSRQFHGTYWKRRKQYLRSLFLSSSTSSKVNYFNLSTYPDLWTWFIYPRKWWKKVVFFIDKCAYWCWQEKQRMTIDSLILLFYVNTDVQLVWPILDDIIDQQIYSGTCW